MSHYHATKSINFDIEDLKGLNDAACKLADIRGIEYREGRGPNQYRSELVRFAVRYLIANADKLLPVLAANPS